MKDKKIIEALGYAQHIEANQKTINWIEHNLKNHLDKGDVPTEEIEHVIDYLAQSSISNMDRMTYEQAKKKSQEWVEKLKKQADKITEKPEDVKIIHDFGDGFKIVQLIGENAYKREGKLMSNCVASYYGRKVEIYSLRDKFNNPHCTMEKDQQVKGKGNGDIDPKYVGYVVKFLEIIGMEVGPSEMAHLGYVDVSGVEDKNAVFKPLFQNKYFYKRNKILDKKGQDYQNMTLWNSFNIFDLDARLNIHWNFDIDLCVKTFIASLKKRPTISSDKDYSAATNTGYYSAATNTGDESAATNTGDRSAATNTGYRSAATNTGYRSAATNTGDESAATNTGYRSAATNTGDESAALTVGYQSKSRVEKDTSIAISTGTEGMASGKKGCWLVLVERNKDGDLLDVKTVKIDGKKIKEDTWYKLENKNFKEVY